MCKINTIYLSALLLFIFVFYLPLGSNLLEKTSCFISLKIGDTCSSKIRNNLTSKNLLITHCLTLKTYSPLNQSYTRQRCSLNSTFLEKLKTLRNIFFMWSTFLNKNYRFLELNNSFFECNVKWRLSHNGTQDFFMVTPKRLPNYRFTKGTNWSCTSD